VVDFINLLVDKTEKSDYYMDSMPAANVDPTPVPRDLEEKNEFIARYVKESSTKIKGTVLVRRNRAEKAWQEAKKRSIVSVKNSDGEWLMFDGRKN
jgi:hypothetical protein